MSIGGEDCAVLVLSSDRYADLWPVFFGQFQRRWPDCPFSVFLGSNTVALEGYPFVRTVLSGPDRDWSSSLRAIVRQMPERYLIMTHEDFIIAEDVDTPQLLECLAFMRGEGARHMQLWSGLAADRVVGGRYGVIEKGAPYRVNTVGIWEKATLEHLLLDGESPWQFEIMGSYRSSFLDGFLRHERPPIVYVNLVEKGSYIPAAVRLLEQAGVSLPPRSRPTLSGRWRLRSWLQKVWFLGMAQMPWRWRVRVMNTLRKLLISY
jgi:hypothetical protein